MSITHDQVTRELELTQQTLSGVNATIQDLRGKIDKGELEEGEVAFELAKAGEDKQHCEERIAGLTELREAVEGLERVDAALSNWKEQIDKGEIDAVEIPRELSKAEKDRETYRQIILERATSLSLQSN
jgi:chromosome segregation ATPase